MKRVNLAEKAQLTKTDEFNELFEIKFLQHNLDQLQRVMDSNRTQGYKFNIASAIDLLAQINSAHESMMRHSMAAIGLEGDEREAEERKFSNSSNVMKIYKLELIELITTCL
jgi:hypothetical protein